MSRHLIGREHELTVLRSLVAEVAGGSPGALLLTGPPGVGKTRLGRESLGIAAASGFSTYAGRAHGLDHEVAYAPVVAALDAELRGAVPARLAGLAGDLPQLGLLFAGLDLERPIALGDPSLERARLLNALSQLVERLAKERPLALLIDDVHLADASTWTFLPYLVDMLTDRPMLLVLTARSSQPGTEHLRMLADTLEESPWSLEQVDVAPLSDGAATALIESVLGQPVHPHLAAAVAERCAGRPLFIEAVVRTLSENGQLVTTDGMARTSEPDLPLPEIVRDQLRIRLAGLSTAERSVLDCLAASDGGLGYRLLAHVVEPADEDLLATLDHLHQRALLSRRDPSASYDVVHALLRDTLLADMSPARLVQLHFRLAEALIDENSPPQRAAEHILLADGLIRPERALDPLIHGAAQSAALGENGSAARYLRAAVEAAGQLDRFELVADLKSRLATALRLGSDRRTAQAAWTDARCSCQVLGDHLGVSRAEQELGMLAWSDGDLDQAQDHFRSAERSLEGLAPSDANAQLMFGNVVMASRVGDAERVTRLADDLSELSDALRSPGVEAQALLARAVLDYAGNDYVGMVETNRSALVAATRAGDQLLVLRANDQLSVAYASQLDIPGLRRTTQQSLDIADRLGSPALGGWPRCRMAVADLLCGDWDSALRNTTEMCEVTRRFNERRGSVSALAIHAWVLVHRGRLTDAENYLATARDRATTMLEADRNIFSIVAIAGAASALARNDAAEATKRAAQLEVATGGWLPLLGLAILGEARARADDLAGASSVVDRLRSIRSCATVAPCALAERVQAVIAGHKGDAATSAQHFAAAGVAFEQLGMPFHVASAALGVAIALTASRPEHAVERAQEALATFERLGAPVQAQQARTVLRELGVSPSRGRRRTAPTGGLSARELEVGRLVAAGLSNAQVATELFISPRTVTTHLDRIYAKLTLTSRVALTRYLADSGLLDQTAST